jgi:hypothetical protein
MVSPDNTRHAWENTQKLLAKTYEWLHTTFKWSPVFDWDCFVNPGPADRSDYTNLMQQYGFSIATDEGGTNSQYHALIAEVSKQFQHMSAAKIPVHILLGRRHPDASYLYWGWPYDASVWEKSLQAPFDAGLKVIASQINTMSIFYDIRNPLDEQSLGEIDAKEPYQAPFGRCPRPQCPWKRTDCPFEKQWRDPDPASQPQKMPNGKVLNTFRFSKYEPASNLSSCPLTGEATENRPYDSDKEDATPTLHQLAQRAAYEREALGWQRFWTEYVSQMTSLSELRVRMPRCFDKVGSWGLSVLLGRAKHWKMIAHADEWQYVQSGEDLMDRVERDGAAGVCTHIAEEKAFPAGRFVRRTWVCCFRFLYQFLS